jgi:hypothetical protein
MAVDLVGGEPKDGGDAAIATDITGAQASPEDVKRIEESLEKL